MYGKEKERRLDREGIWVGGLTNAEVDRGRCSVVFECRLFETSDNSGATVFMFENDSGR